MEFVKPLASPLSATRAKHKLAFRLALCAISAMITTTAGAQTLGEWFNQKKTQKKYLLQQIAALRAYGYYLNKGYQIGSNGLKSVSGSLLRELNAHQSFYDGLYAVNTTIKHDPRIEEIMTWEQGILSAFAAIYQAAVIRKSDRSYLGEVRDVLFSDCDRLITSLHDLLKNGALGMNDEQRLKRLQRIHGAMRENYRFALQFTGDFRALAVAQEKSTKGLEKARIIHGIQKSAK